MIYRGVFSIVLLATIGLALYPDLKLPNHWLAGGQTDRVYHVAAFAVLAVLAGFAWRLRTSLVIGLAMLAVGIEAAQILAPGRRADALDLMASLVGLALGVSAVRLMKSARNRRLRVG
jgi:VanZ family protein